MLGFERVLEEIVRTAEGVDFRREKGESVLMAADLSVLGKRDEVERFLGE